MKRKFTPEVTLQMLKELKKSVEDKTFIAGDFKDKYPTYYNFRKFIFSKGLMIKKHGIEEWISIEPNIYMAKEILTLYLNYTRENNNRYRENLKEKKLQKNDFPKILLDIENDKVKKEVQEQPIFVDVEPFAITKHIENLTNDVAILQGKLKNKDEIILSYHETIHLLEEKIKIIEDLNSELLSSKLKPEPTPIIDYGSVEFSRDLTSQERMSNVTNTKTYKVFGITVFSIIKK